MAKDINLLLSGETIAKKEHSKIISEQFQTNEVIDGSKNDVIIIEGIYALNELLINNLGIKDSIKNYMDGSEKTLFLRRVIRDSKITSLNNAFTIRNYLDFVFPSFKALILPTKKLADIICRNDMTFEELRNGEITSKQQKVKVIDYKIIDLLKK